jgi:hypothetical protein
METKSKMLVVLAAAGLALVACGKKSEPVPAKELVVPDAPTGVVAEPGVRSARVSWDAPANDGGSPVTGYTVTAAPGGASQSTAETSATVSALEDGATYTFTVVATNAAGTSAPSAPSAPVTTFSTPGMPTGVTATAGVRSATVTWTAPTSDGGSPIERYEVTVSPDAPAAEAVVDGTRADITGLENGIAYTFAVTAWNAVGAGQTSVPSNAVTTPDVPVAPGAPEALAGDGSATLTWSAPPDGGSPITGYAIAILPETPGAATAVEGTHAVVSGLANGTTYTFRVAATNAVGEGPYGESSNPVTPFGGLTPGTHTLVLSIEAIGEVAVGGASATLALPPGVSVACDPVTGEVAAGSLGAGNGLPETRVLVGRYNSETRLVNLALAIAADSPWSGEAVWLEVIVEPGIRVESEDILELNAPFPAFEAAGLDTRTRDTTDLSDEVRPRLSFGIRTFAGVGTDVSSKGSPAAFPTGPSGERRSAGTSSLGGQGIGLRVTEWPPAPDGTLTATLSLDPGDQPVYSLDLVLAYDPALGTPTTVSLDTGADGWMMTSNASRPGEILVSMAGATPITEEAALLALTFVVTNHAQDVALLAPTVSINETLPAEVDYTLSVAHAEICARMAAGVRVPTDPELPKYDRAPLVNGAIVADGSVDIADVMVILRDAAGFDP